jgi:hypothetical protein
MPITLVETPGAANANTWASLAEYKSYIETRRPQLSWFAAALAGTSLDEQLKIDLVQACRLIDRSFDWTGTIADDVQILMWPRLGMVDRAGRAILSTVNPRDLKDSQCEMSVQLHSDETDLLSDDEVEKGGIAAVKAGSVEVEFQERDTSTLEGADVVVRQAGSQFNYMSDSIPAIVRRLLVPSWFKESESGLSKGWIFEVM